MKKTMFTLLIAGLATLFLTACISSGEREINTVYESPYMNAAGTPLTELENGAVVTGETTAYWNLDSDSPERTSYDRDEIIEVSEGVWTLASASIANTHVIEAPEGLIVCDTGDNQEEGKHFYDMLRSVTDEPIRAIVYSHEHYALGAGYMVEKEAERGNTDIMIIGHPDLNMEMLRTGGVSALHPEVSGVLIARSIEQFNFYLPDEGPDARYKNTIIPGSGGFVPVNTPVEDGQTVNIAGLDVTFFTEGIQTDTENQVLLWIPSRGITFDNILWGWYPNLYSARGGRYRNPQGWMNAVEKMMELEPEITLSVHSTTMNDPRDIQERLQAYRDGIAYVLDQTLKGIALGEGPDELRYSVQLPGYLSDNPILIQNYGEVATMAPRIFTALFGQFDRNAVNLNKLHPDEEAERMVDAMGGAEEVKAMVESSLEKGDYLWAGQLADYLNKTDPASEEYRALKAESLRQMGYRSVSTNTRSWYLSQARELEGDTAILKNAPADPASVAANLRDYVDFYRIRINPESSGDTDALMQLSFSDGRTYGLHIRKAVVDFVEEPDRYGRDADIVLEMPAELWAGVYNNTADPAGLIADGAITVTRGTADEAAELFSMFDPVYDWENDPALKALF